VAQPALTITVTSDNKDQSNLANNKIADRCCYLKLMNHLFR